MGLLKHSYFYWAQAAKREQISMWQGRMVCYPHMLDLRYFLKYYILPASEIQWFVFLKKSKWKESELQKCCSLGGFSYTSPREEPFPVIHTDLSSGCWCWCFAFQHAAIAIVAFLGCKLICGGLSSLSSNRSSQPPSVSSLFLLKFTFMSTLK